MKILIISSYVPHPPNSGGKLRVLNLMQRISRHHEVSLLSMVNPLTIQADSMAYLRTFCARVDLVAARKRSKPKLLLQLLKGVLDGEPARNIFFHYEEMAERIRVLTESEDWDIVDIQHSYMGPYVQAVSPMSRGRKILTLHNVAFVQYRRMMSVETNWRSRLMTFLDWLFLKRSVLKHARRFDKCIAMSEFDRDIIKRAGPDLDVAIVPNGVDTQNYPLLSEQATTPTLLFVGKMSYPPNVDGVTFFCRNILPLIKQQIPATKLLIVGSEPASAVRALASDDVTVTGYVEDIIPHYQHSAVAIAPLRAGSGTRLKILESMALGRPVVTTTLGCEGLAVTPEEDILIADTPTGFAAQTVRLLNDAELRRRLITNGRRLVETTYDWDAIAQQLLKVYEEVALTRQQAS